jgi:hypothetical protein
VANLCPRPCVTSCASMKLMECTQGISPVIRHRMAACGCPNNWRLHSSVLSKSERRSQFSAERRGQTNTLPTACHRIEECSRGLVDQWIPDFNPNTILVISIPGGADFDSGRRRRFTFGERVSTPETEQHRNPDQLTRNFPPNSRSRGIATHRPPQLND